MFLLEIQNIIDAYRGQRGRGGKGVKNDPGGGLTPDFPEPANHK